EIARRYFEGPSLRGGRPAFQPPPQRLVDDLAKRPAGALRFRLELGRHVVIQGQRRPHALMLQSRHHDAKGFRAADEAWRCVRATAGYPRRSPVFTRPTNRTTGFGKAALQPSQHAYRARVRSALEIPLGESIYLGATEESFAGTLQNTARRVTGFGIVDRTACRDDAPVTLTLKDDDLFRVTEHGNVRVVGYDHDLPSLFGPPKHRDERAVNELPVQIVLGLIDDQRVASVRRQHQRQQDRLLLS